MAQDSAEEYWHEEPDDEVDGDVFADELTDDDLIDAAKHLSDYTEEGQQAVMEELQQRGLPLPIQETIPKPRKSVAAAVLLAFFFGPIGMVYVRRFWQSLLISYVCFIGGIAIGLPVLEMVLPPHTLEIYFSGVAMTIGALHLVVYPLWAYSRARAINRAQ